MRVLGGLEAVSSPSPPASSLLVLVASGKGWVELGATGGGGFTEDTFTTQTGRLT